MFPIRDTIPSRHLPVMTWALIAANAIVFFHELEMPEPELRAFFHLFGVVPARYTHPGWALSVGLPPWDLWPFLSSQFLHGGWMHVIGNMWTLWIFGDNVEDRMGPLRFLLFYLMCGVIAALVHTVSQPDSTLPVVGASGAIAGVLGAYFVLFPTSRVLTMIPIFFWPFFVEIPAVTFLAIWFLTQLFAGTLTLGTPGAVGGVAWWAHVGGFVAGAVFYRRFLSRRRLPPPPRVLVRWL